MGCNAKFTFNSFLSFSKFFPLYHCIHLQIYFVTYILITCQLRPCDQRDKKNLSSRSKCIYFVHKILIKIILIRVKNTFISIFLTMYKYKQYFTQDITLHERSFCLRWKDLYHGLFLKTNSFTLYTDIHSRIQFY